MVVRVNVLVFVSDALRADHIGVYGARSVNTTTLDSLAEGGLRFNQAISAAPWTAPSMMSMVTGLYPHRHGYYAWTKPDPAIRTIFDSFVEADCDVATFVFDSGFLFKGLRNSNVLGETDTMEDVIAWLRKPHERPFLCFVHSWATHMPRSVRHGERKEWRSAKLEFLARLQEDTASGLESCRAEYRDGVEFMSEVLLADLLGELDSTGLRENTAVVFLSDHGESWGERLVDKRDLVGIYHLHGSTLYDEIIRVPLIISAPRLFDRNVINTQVSSVDVAPTLLEIAGVAPMECDGVSLLARTTDDEINEPVFSFTTDRGMLSQAAIRQPPWKLIRDLKNGSEQAYRLDCDAKELQNRISDVPIELRFRLDRELEDAEYKELSEEEENAIISRLSDLGYM